jgi:hypothetical protein
LGFQHIEQLEQIFTALAPGGKVKDVSLARPSRVQSFAFFWKIYCTRNEIERLFQILLGYRRIFSRFEKLDCLFLGFLCFALIVEALI